MIRRAEVLHKLEECRQGRFDLDRFEDWFRDESRGYGASQTPEVDSVCTEVEFAISQYRYEDVAEKQVVADLTRLLRPLVRVTLAESDSDKIPSEVQQSTRVSRVVTAASAPVLELEAA